jgi:hypothetical protein
MLNAVVAYLKSVSRPFTDSRKVPAISNLDRQEMQVYSQLKIRFTCFPHFRTRHVHPPLRRSNSLRRRRRDVR